MKTMEEMIREAKEKKVEINVHDFLEKSAKVAASEPFAGLTSDTPSLILLLATFSSALAHEIFDKKEEE